MNPAWLLKVQLFPMLCTLFSCVHSSSEANLWLFTLQYSFPCLSNFAFHGDLLSTFFLIHSDSILPPVPTRHGLCCIQAPVLWYRLFHSAFLSVYFISLILIFESLKVLDRAGGSVQGTPLNGVRGSKTRLSLLSFPCCLNHFFFFFGYDKIHGKSHCFGLWSRVQFILEEKSWW